MSVTDICRRAVLAKAESIQAVIDAERSEVSTASRGVGQLLTALSESLECVEYAFRRELGAAISGSVSEDALRGICTNYLVLLRKVHEHLRHLLGTRDTDFPTELISPAEAILRNRLTKYSHGLVLRSQTDYMYEVNAYLHFVHATVQAVCSPLPPGLPSAGIPDLMVLLPLPYAEQDSMRLHTVLLGHELGHVIDIFETETTAHLVAALRFDKTAVEDLAASRQARRGGSLFVLVGAVRNDAQKKATLWLRELVADLIATRSFGPAYLASLIELWFPLGFARNAWDEEHPSWETRIDFILRELKRMGFTTEAGAPFWELLAQAEALAGEYTLPAEGTLERIAIDGILALDLEPFEAVEGVIEEATAFTRSRFETEVPPLIALLGEGIPAAQIIEHQTKSAEPAEVAAILNAGWAAYLSDSAKIAGLMGVEEDDVGWPPAVGRKIDALLAKSLEAAEFLRQWRANE